MSKRAAEGDGNTPAAKSLRTSSNLPVPLSSSHERVLFRVLSYCLSADEITSTNVNISVLGGTKVKYSDAKWDLLRVCKEWSQLVMKWSKREVMLDLNFRRKLVRSQMKCENEKRWDVLSVGYLTSREDDVLKMLTYNPTTKPRDDASTLQLKKDEPEKELKILVPPLAENLPKDQLQQITELPLLSKSVSLSQITQICILVKIYHPLNFSTIECPNLHRLRLSGLSLSSPPPSTPNTDATNSPSSSYAHLFECLDSTRMSNLRHLQLELRVEETGEKREVGAEGQPAVVHLHSTSLQRLSLDNYYADYFFNVSLDCPNMSSVYLRCIKFALGAAFDSFCSLAANRHVTLWLDYITFHTPNGHLVRMEETNLHMTVEYKRSTRTLALSRAGLRKLVVNGSTLSFDDKPNAVVVEVDGEGVWVECDGRRSRYERTRGDVRVEMEGEKDGEKGRLVCLCK